MEALRCRDQITELLTGFPFVSGSDRSVALSAILCTVVWVARPRPAPARYPGPRGGLRDADCVVAQVAHITA